MKKFLKVFLPILAIVLMIAFAICKSIIPEQTDLFIENVKIVLDRPIVIAGFSITIGGLLMFVFTRYIIRNTKFGRKELDKMKDEIELNKKHLEEKALEVKSLAEHKIDELKDLKDECEGKMSVVYNEFKDLKNILLDSLKAIPNKKIQEKVAQYEEKFDEKEQELLEKTLNTNVYIDEKIKKLEEEFHNALLRLENQYEERIDDKATKE